MTLAKPLFPLLSLFFFSTSFAQVKAGSIRIMQGDSVYLLTNSTRSIQLARKSFKIQVLLQNLEGVYAFVSFKDSMDRLMDDQMVPGFDQIPAMLNKEEDYNKEKELMVADDHWCYWSSKPSGFNRKMVFLDQGRIVGIKSVKQLHFTSTGKTVKLKDIREPLYLFIVAVAETGADGKPNRELFRQRLKVDWYDED